MLRRQLLTALAALALAGVTAAAIASRAADRPFILLQSTTSTENSGLFDHLLPQFTAETGIEVRVVAVGTGQALKNAQNGDGDVVLVHARAAEEKFVAEGHGVERLDVMCNDFVIVGPAADPAGIRGMDDAPAALARIAAAGAPFASRGDGSGTHQAELALWQAAGVDVATASGGWYRETGAGMGPTLNVAAGMGAYALADRATWASFRNRQDLAILVAGDPTLRNPYGSILVDPARHPHVEAADARIWHDWLTSPEGQRAIAAFRIGGEQLFFPDARPPGA
jgi:tungstate transport system substrate-binding protein